MTEVNNMGIYSKPDTKKSFFSVIYIIISIDQSLGRAYNTLSSGFSMIQLLRHIEKVVSSSRLISALLGN